jgi:glycosyltransferase involved in cell wall biosynthesis
VIARADDVAVNLLHITTFLQGGAGRLICDLARRQQELGHSVRVVATGEGPAGYGNYPEWIESLRVAGVATRFIDSTFRRDYALNLQAASHLRSWLSDWSVDLVHAHAAVPALIGLLATSDRDPTVPVIQTMHGWSLDKSPSQAATDVAIMNQLDAVVPVSRAASRVIEQQGVDRSRLAVIRCAIDDLPGPAPPPDSPRVAAWRRRGDTVLCCLGTIGARKNQRLLVESLADWRARRVSCVFVGDGDVSGTVRLAEVLGIADRVWFTGYQEQGWRFLALADWLVLPSAREGLPVAVLEAFRAGVPVLASDIPEVAELVTSGEHGLLFAAGDRNACADALQVAARMPVEELRRMGRAGRARYEVEYGLTRMVDAYELLYRSLIASVGVGVRMGVRPEAFGSGAADLG